MLSLNFWGGTGGPHVPTDPKSWKCTGGCPKTRVSTGILAGAEGFGPPLSGFSMRSVQLGPLPYSRPYHALPYHALKYFPSQLTAVARHVPTRLTLHSYR